MHTRSHVKSALIIAAVAFGALNMNVQAANAETKLNVVSPQAPSNLKSKDRVRVARAHRRTTRKHAVAPAPTTGANTEPVFLSDAWLKQEKRTDDRLKRFMNICKGC